jgi:hypothetical protein
VIENVREVSAQISKLAELFQAGQVEPGVYDGAAALHEIKEILAEVGYAAEGRIRSGTHDA